MKSTRNARATSSHLTTLGARLRIVAISTVSGHHTIISRVDNDACRPPTQAVASELTVMSTEFPPATRLPGTGHTARAARKGRAAESSTPGFRTTLGDAYANNERFDKSCADVGPLPPVPRF